MARLDDYPEYRKQRRRALIVTAAIIGVSSVVATIQFLPHSPESPVLLLAVAVTTLSAVVVVIGVLSLRSLEREASTRLFGTEVTMARLRQDPALRRRLAEHVFEIRLVRGVCSGFDVNAPVLLREESLSGYALEVVTHDGETLEVALSNDEMLIESCARWLAERLDVPITDARVGVPQPLEAALED